MNDVAAVLTGARELISDPERWTQHVYARDAEGWHTGWDSPKAVCWCAVGAVGRAAQVVQEESVERNALVFRAMDELRRVIGDHGVSSFNDHYAHADVLHMFDQAIAASRPQENEETA